MRIAVTGAGAFGTALASTLARSGRDVLLWGRDPDAMQALAQARTTPRLPGITLAEQLSVTSDLKNIAACDMVLLCTPAQTLAHFAAAARPQLRGKPLVACCKGIDLATLRGPTATLADLIPESPAAVLTGPSFAADIAQGLPTALTLACRDEKVAKSLQQTLSTDSLRLYTTTDTIGAELGGALKNVIAIGCGVAIGSGLGDSARAALLTRGFAEMQRLAQRLGADPATLNGLSGLGDLALTCTSLLSRNYRYGLALGEGSDFDTTTTVEGVATARAVAKLAVELDIELPICTVVGRLADGSTDVAAALSTLLTRPLKEE